MQVKHDQPRGSISSQAVIGLIVIVVGLLLFFQTMGMATLSGLLVWIPSLFILLGLWQLVANGFRQWSGPMVLIALATLAQLLLLGIIGWDFVGRLWPLVLILIGVSLVMRRGGMLSTQTDSEDYVRLLALFSGHKRVITSQSFAGGEITALFGGAELDLRQAAVHDRPARVQIFAMFGGVGIKASPDMLIRTELIAILGGAGDERRQRKSLPDEMPEVVISGLVLFGGVGIEEN